MDFYHYYKSRKGEMVNLLKEMVHRESPSNDKKSVDACSAFVVKEFSKHGAKVDRFPQKGIGTLYVARYPSPTPKSLTEQILLLTHIDTVWPVGKLHTMPFYVSEDKVFGPGVLDMKASIVMTLFSLKAVQKIIVRPLSGAFSSWRSIKNPEKRASCYSSGDQWQSRSCRKSESRH